MNNSQRNRHETPPRTQLARIR